MLKYVQAFRKRFALQVNDHSEEDAQLLYIKDSRFLEWLPIGLDEFGSQTALVRGLKLGTQAKISTHPYTDQCFLLADMMTDRAVGRIEINNMGAISIHDFPTWSVRNIQDMYETRITAIIGFRGPATLNFTDEQNGDVDILRLKIGQTKIFVPAKYLKPTAAYDNQKHRTPVAAILPSNGWSASQSTASQSTASTSTGGFTLRPIVLPPFPYGNNASSGSASETDNDGNASVIEVDDGTEARTEAPDDSETIEIIEPAAEEPAAEEPTAEAPNAPQPPAE